MGRFTCRSTSYATCPWTFVGRYLARVFAKHGFNIVSGLAIGCDTCGHEGALEVGGKTTAFFANGLDRKLIYPKENLALVERIVASGGLLLSEYPIGQKTSRFALVARDRLHAGLAWATVVVQSSATCGTMHAAKATHASGKPLFVLDVAGGDCDAYAGNRLLVEKQWARCISGETDMDVLANELKGVEPTVTHSNGKGTPVTGWPTTGGVR